jgi:hypothetical protein
MGGGREIGCTCTADAASHADLSQTRTQSHQIADVWRSRQTLAGFICPIQTHHSDTPFDSLDVWIEIRTKKNEKSTGFGASTLGRCNLFCYIFVQIFFFFLVSMYYYVMPL